MLITLFTNGTLVTSEIADQLVQLPPFSIEITIYGHTKATYESISRISGSYERCLNGIQMLMARKLPLKLKTMAIAQNKHELPEMKRFAEEELKQEFKFDAMINPRRDCSQSPLEVRLAPSEIVELDLKNPERVADWIQFAGKFNNLVLSPANADRLYVCGGGQNSFAIDAFGRLAACILSPADTFNLRQGSFKKGWQKYLLELRQKKVTRQTKCSACQIRAMCGMCPVNSELECREAETPVDFLCQVAHLRAYALGLPIAPHGECEYCPGGSRYAEMMETAGGLKERFA